MNFQLPKISEKPLNLLEIPYQKAFLQLQKGQQSMKVRNFKGMQENQSFFEKVSMKLPTKKSFDTALEQSTDTVWATNIPTYNFKIFKQNISPREEKYKLHIDPVIQSNSLQIPHFSKKGPHKFPLYLNKIPSPNKRIKTDVNDDFQCKHHFPLQTINKRQKKLVQNIQSLIEMVNSSQDEKLCKHFDKLTLDLKLS